MHTSALETPLIRPMELPGRLIVGAALRRCAENTTRFLDDAVPLDGASHARVDRYEIRTVWRKPECIAVLKDGGEARLLDSWQFVAYTRGYPCRSLLFRNHAMHVELLIDCPEMKAPQPDEQRVFIGRDGNLISLPRQRLTLVRKA